MARTTWRQGQSPPVHPLTFAPSDLDERARTVFRHIVDAYLETGVPVGSRNLSQMLPMQLSPASIRNVMSDLEALGLLAAPHTSAGRLPTQAGLRFFVDAFLETGELSSNTRDEIERGITGDAPTKSPSGPEDVLGRASQLLSGLSRGAGVVMAATQDLRLRHIEFIRLEPAKALVVLVGEDGTVENRVIPLDPGLPASALTQASNYLNAYLAGRTVAEARAEMERARGEAQAEIDRLTKSVVDAGLAVVAEQGAGRPATLIVRGRANLLEQVSAAEDLERMRHLFDDLERKQEIVSLLSAADAGEGVRIFIGSENKLFSLSGSSLVTAPYRDANESVVGVLGVIGPTRLNYARIVPVVDYTAQVVQRLLDRS